ncbi:signal peptidase I [Candidatus Woesearchaeota archaeon]|nr:MAG: signal peptidase I [Candidatus Woesearchaeota archaeon]
MGIYMLKKIIILILVFFLGVFSTSIYANLHKEMPLNTVQITEQVVKTPSDRIKENQIEVYSNRVVLDIKDPEWAMFTATGSMEPVLNENSHAIEVVPKSEDEIQVGDIVAYKSQYAEGTIIHRVVYKGNDEDGTYFVLKGDNNPTSDPGRVRFSQIKRVVVAIIY